MSRGECDGKIGKRSGEEPSGEGASSGDSSGEEEKKCGLGGDVTICRRVAVTFAMLWVSDGSAGMRRGGAVSGGGDEYPTGMTPGSSGI